MAKSSTMQFGSPGISPEEDAPIGPPEIAPAPPDAPPDEPIGPPEIAPAPPPPAGVSLSMEQLRSLAGGQDKPSQMRAEIAAFKRGHPRILPEICRPGEAMIQDEFGDGRKTVPTYNVMRSNSVVRTNEPGEFRPRPTGQLVDAIHAKDLVVVQFAPYPPGSVIQGSGAFFNGSENYIEHRGAFFHPQHLPESIRQTRAKSGR